MALRTCESCGAPLQHHRSHARYCGGACRAAASRERIALRASATGWDAFVAGLRGKQGNRTQAHRLSRRRRPASTTSIDNPR